MKSEEEKATVVAITVLRKKEAERRPGWEMIEEKALVWLERVENGVDWRRVIERAAETINEELKIGYTKIVFL